MVVERDSAETSAFRARCLVGLLRGHPGGHTLLLHRCKGLKGNRRRDVGPRLPPSPCGPPGWRARKTAAWAAAPLGVRVAPVTRPPQLTTEVSLRGSGHWRSCRRQPPGRSRFKTPHEAPFVGPDENEFNPINRNVKIKFLKEWTAVLRAV